MQPERRTLVGLSLVCAANLLLEVSLTRIFSALMFYHFTFFAIALALLGIGASGVYVYVRADRFTPATVRVDLARNARWFAAATLVALLYVLANPVVVYIEFGESPTFTNQTLFQLVLLCGIAALPFFFAGMVVSLAITHFRAAIERVYFYDLAGAGLAALVVGLAIGVLGGPGLVVGVALLACVASALFQTSRTAIAALTAAGLLFLAALGTGWFAPPSTKMVRSDRVVFDGWNTFSHITLEQVGGGHDIRIDAAARTHVTRKAEASNPAWAADITALAYHLHSGVHPGGADSVLIIGPGGGVDVAHALASGARHVTGVDINPLIAGTIMKGRYKQLSDGLYDDPRVTIRIDEGRSFIRRSRQRYDVIQATLVDTWAATASGAFALTENTLYTVEAFDDYYAHLSPTGVLTMSRWWTFASAPETLRLVVLAAAALEHRGVKPGMTQHHLFLVRKDNLSTLLVKPAGFTTGETEQLVALATLSGYEVLLGPNIAREPNLARFLTAGAWSDTVRAYPLDMRPPTDDRPFFFYFVKAADLFSWSNLTDKKLANPALWLLASLGSMLVALTIVFVFLPLFWRLDDLRGPRLRRRVLGLGYFAAIGFGFMVVEIALIQRLSLFLGHPSYSLIVVLFGILVGTAVGARSTRRFATRAGLASLAGGLAVALLAILAAFLLADLLRSLITMPLPGRMALAAAVVFAFGLVMGVMLPLGVTLLAREDETIIPWAWGINGGMSVIGTVGATIVAINAGFTATFLVGAALYVAAGATGFWLSRRA